jgi:glycosyltransferase involved in cell wall biosynthesis
MIKVCFPLEGLNNSGGLRVITDLANYLSENGFIVDVIVPDYRSNCFYPFSEKINLRIVKTNSILNKKLIYLYYLIRYSAKNKYNFTFATGYKTPFFIFSSKLLNISTAKIVYIIQHYEISSQIQFNNKENKVIKLLKISIAKFGFYVPSIKIAVSNWIKLQLNDSKINVIPNGVDLNIFKVNILPDNREFYSIGIVGSSKPIKGYDLIIKAITNLRIDLKSKIKLTILSNDKIELPSNINFQYIIPKTSDDISSFYNCCNIFIFGSYEEGFGLPPLEAMASGCVILSSDCGGVRTFLNESNAFLFNPGDYEQLTKKLEFILSYPFQVNQIRQEGILKSKEFSSELMLSSYLKLLKSY